MQCKMFVYNLLFLCSEFIEIFFEQIFTTYLRGILFASRVQKNEIFSDEDVNLLDAACEKKVGKLNYQVC